MKNLNPRHRMNPKKLSFLTYPEDVSKLNNLYLETDLGIVDLISQITGVGNFEKISQNAQTIQVFGRTCKVISIEDLISAKEALGRPKDIMMANELRVIREKISEKKKKGQDP